MTAIDRDEASAVAGREGRRWTAKVAVRIPRNDGPALTRAAARRLRRNPHLAEVEVVDVCGLEPGLSATDLVCTVQFITHSSAEKMDVAELLESMTGVEAVRRVERRS